ncbi:P-loop containing nucleoside triphosphate hydrolase protein [Chytriomyces sp. MP71]|nr:P-loop containing nucleoside triphosphate hydrolase protein [Chytriomyces sp. MP71]
MAADALTPYVKGTKAWFTDDSDGWIVASVVERSVGDEAVTIAFETQNGKRILFEAQMSKLVADKFASLPPLKNPPMLEGIDDLSNLSYLHEPEVLHNIKLRYLQEQIYTYSGIVLIAMNPFQRLALYSSDIMREYSGKRRGELEPHLFAVAEEAYRTMIREKKNQSIIVSGESGAGKTQSAKYIMRYFATVDNLESRASDNAGGSGISEIEEAVLSTNPIMESFGNSKTTRNDNSSRFGKYIEILFSKPSGPNKSVNIVGAKIRTYLLERSRLIFQPATERNYHIFYQLCAAVPAAERKELGLGKWNEFHYLNQGGSGVIHGFDDAAEFAVTQQALSTIGISVSAQWNIFKICAALLHIGNIKITNSRSDEAQIDDSDAALKQASTLLQISTSDFKKWIIKKQITTRSEKITSTINGHQATVGRDSIAKFIYTMLFDWLVKVINRNLWREELRGEDLSFIGVLDIYGFEHFKKNSFEQFCINYANEKLQQEFNQHVFKLEQEEYVAEKIQWSFIDFNDNQPCIDLIEGKLGVLDLLDEESRLPSGSDGSLITKLYQRFDGKHKFFAKPRFGQSAFTVKHYALDVTYDVDGFIEKNKDTVTDEQLASLNSSTFTFFKEILVIEDGVTSAPQEAESSASKRMSMLQVRKPTLGSIFKNSLVNLMATLRTTQVHYIRCIKPNHSKTPFGFEAQLVLSQLRACGVLETIRISCAGYPSRWTFQEFADRYYILVPSMQWTADPKLLTARIAEGAIREVDLYQVGLSKIFFRAGQLAFLEKKRSEKLRYCVVMIQKNIRMFIYRAKYVRMVEAAIAIQTAFRGYSARTKYKKERADRAATKLQSAIRRYLAVKLLQQKRAAIIIIQSTYRMRIAVRTYQILRRERAAVKIQAAFRGYQTRNAYLKSQQQVILLQSCVRRAQAVAVLRQLKVEAKSVGKLKALNYTLENKVVELSQSVKAHVVENKSLADKVQNLESQLVSWKEKFSRVESTSKNAVGQLEGNTAELKAELKIVTEAKDNIVKDVDRLTSEVVKRDAQIAHLTTELGKSKDEIRKLKDEFLHKAPVPAKVASVSSEDMAMVAQLRRENSLLKEQVMKLAERSQPVDYDRKAGVLPTEIKAMSVKVPDVSNAPMEAIEYLNPAASFDDKALEEEVIDSLITNLRIPLPSTQTVATRGEIFFPAHLIGLSMKQLLLFNLGTRTQVIMSNITTAIQLLTKRFEDDYVSAFWLSNCFELSCISKFLHTQMEARYRTEFEGSETELLLKKVQRDLSTIMTDIYSGWIKVLKRRLSNMIIPAVVENQSLPAYMNKQVGASWSKMGKTPGGTQFKIEQLLNFLTKLSKTLRCYYMNEFISSQILSELVRVIGVSAFNHLLVRKNFCTWKRGMQLQHNAQRLDEWCQTQNIPQATAHLQPFLQASKLLILMKSPPKDADIVFKECFLLNPTQIKKLLSLYYAADFDSPLPPQLLSAVSSHESNDDGSGDILSLDSENVADFMEPASTPLENGMDPFMPQWLSLPHIRALLN